MPRPTRATPAPRSTRDGRKPGDAIAEWNDRVTQLLTFLPTALQGRPEHVYPAESAVLWPYHQQVYRGLTQTIYRKELDPRLDR
ncbi:hypothetical protein [Microbispora sp. NPDC046933]|uniref:hypothetical protein n=1 Tax=Microbispora sp. NPDC046933 TaxID=3155618 RepID=UPI0033EB0825